MTEFTLDDWKNSPVQVYLTSPEADAELQEAMQKLQDVCEKYDIQMVTLATTGQTREEYRTYGCTYLSDPGKVSTEVIFGNLMLNSGFAVAYSLIDGVAAAVQDRYTVPYLKEVK